MKKKLNFILIIICISTIFLPRSLSAQKLIFLFGHLQYALPVDNYFKNNYDHGLGVEGGAGFGTGRTFLVGTIGYTSFSNTAKNSTYGSTSYVPIKVGLRHYLFVGKILFLSVNAGVGLINNNVQNSSRFSGDIGLGLTLGPFEIIADYDGYTRTSAENSGYSSWIGIKGGVRFGL
ncbi:MAG TPA: hypothetical protein VMI12_11050 [Puia sp.]|nr:hypothetical protein [Puia sp.]